MGKTEDAQASINRLIQEFQGTNMEDEILMLNSELALKNNDIKKAVHLLKVKMSFKIRKSLQKMKVCSNPRGLN
jgi:outer membrane PBP1 activator LpoA protein